MGDGIIVRVDRSTTFVCAHERRDDPFATRERIAAVALLSPHLRRAIAIGARTVGLGELDPSLPSALDAVDRAVLVLRADAEVEFANPAAHTLVGKADGLRVDPSGRLVAAPRAYGEFRTALDQATTTHGIRRGSGVVIPRPSGRRPLVAAVSPLAGQGSVLRALVVVIDAELDNTSYAPEPLRQCFGLTDTEARVAALLAAGLDLTEIADRLHVARSTIRTHLQHVFDKTNTSRQAELAVLAARLAYTPSGANTSSK